MENFFSLIPTIFEKFFLEVNTSSAPDHRFSGKTIGCCGARRINTSDLPKKKKSDAYSARPFVYIKLENSWCIPKFLSKNFCLTFNPNVVSAAYKKILAYLSCCGAVACIGAVFQLVADDPIRSIFYFQLLLSHYFLIL